MGICFTARACESRQPTQARLLAQFRNIEHRGAVGAVAEEVAQITVDHIQSRLDVLRVSLRTSMSCAGGRDPGAGGGRLHGYAGRSPNAAERIRCARRLC